MVVSRVTPPTYRLTVNRLTTRSQFLLKTNPFTPLPLQVLPGNGYMKNPTLQSQPYPRQGQETNSARFTLEARADLWALVQDDKGAELQWLKMKPGETSTISHSGDLTITCSSGDKLLIKDKFGKKIETNPNASGISIVRLAAN